MNLNRFSQSPPTGFAWLVSLALACLVWLLSSTAAIAAPPPANSVIGNQATATYTDGTGTTRNVTSNLVQTTVAQVYGHTLVSNQTKLAPPGSTVYFPHVLTNTGNGTDTYTLSTLNLGGDFDLTNIRIFADANGDGLPDNAFNITTTPPLATNEEFRFVVAAVVPATQSNGDRSALRVGAVGHPADANNYTAAAGALPPLGAAGVTDEVVALNEAVLSVNKSFDVISGPIGTEVLVTLTYTNIGSAAATNVTLTDTIGAFETAGFTYVAESGTWTTGAATPTGLTDAAAGDPAGINFTADASPGNITAVIASVAPGDSGQVSFRVTVAASAVVGTGTTTNRAGVSYTYGFGIWSAVTNTVVFNVTPTRGVNAQDVLLDGLFADNDTDSDGRNDNVVVASAPQGSSIDYRVYVTNTGNAQDTFNMTIVPGTFPAGTTFQFFSSANPNSATSPAGAPLVDTNGDGIPDTGPVTGLVDGVVGTGTTIPVFVRVQLPAAAVSDIPLTADVRATSVGDANAGTEGINAGNPAATRDVRLTLIDIIEKQVDLTNVLDRCTASDGDGAGFAAQGEGTFRCSKSVEAGQKAVFELVVENTTGSADSYDLLGASSNIDINTAGFVAALPAGWTVEFRRASALNGVALATAQANAASCATATALNAMPVVINTGNINAGAAVAVCAVVSIPANQTNTTQSLFFRAVSPASVSYSTPTAAFDVKHDQVVVLNDKLSALTIAPNRTGQVYPGGNVVYSHEVCNVGTATLTNFTIASTTVEQTPTGWTNALFLDNGGSPGVLDPTDTPLGTSGTIASLAPNTCTTVLNNVFAPLGAPQGAYAVQSLTATYTGGPADGVVVTDTTQVIVGDVTLEKTQGLGTINDAGVCTGMPGAFSVNTLLNTNPGAFVCYNIVAKNTGSGPVTALNIQDVAPQYTNLVTTGACAPTLASGAGTSGAPASPTTSGIYIVSGAVTSVPPGGTVTMQFCVRINGTLPPPGPGPDRG
jgi:trimeric autotransporter adhesin